MKTLARIAAALIALAAMSAAAPAQNYPTRAVTLVVPLSAGRGD